MKDCKVWEDMTRAERQKMVDDCALNTKPMKIVKVK